MPLRTTHAKASAQVRRNDHAMTSKYSAELRRRRPGSVMGFSTAYAVLDEAHQWAAAGVTTKQVMENACRGLRMPPGSVL